MYKTNGEQDKVVMELVGLDGNAFSLMGAFSNNARQQGWSDSRIDEVLDDCMPGDYNHLLAVLVKIRQRKAWNEN